MAKEMTEQEIQRYLPVSHKIDEYLYRNEEDEDDYVAAMLYKTGDGRHFRYVESSGMSSDFSGAGNFGEWLDADEIATWKSFYPR